VGQFTVERRISGVREADLGTLYDPLYFYKGWAIHGSNAVPAQPASHGCVRVTRADAVWLFERVPDGISVHVHGGQHVFTPG
jgi:lipoprotein-anchoring transpeptidase ErfK/SrfK